MGNGPIDDIKAMLREATGDQLVEIGVLLQHERIRRYGRRAEWMARDGVSAGETSPERE